MKKIVLVMVALLVTFITACTEKESEITVTAISKAYLGEYNLQGIAEDFIENEDGSITYTIKNSKLEVVRKEARSKLDKNVTDFNEMLSEVDSDNIAEIGFNDDATVLESTLPNAKAAAAGLFFLVLPSYPDILAVQVLTGLEPTGITLKTTDAETGEVFEETLPF